MQISLHVGARALLKATLPHPQGGGGYPNQQLAGSHCLLFLWPRNPSPIEVHDSTRARGGGGSCLQQLFDRQRLDPSGCREERRAAEGYLLGWREERSCSGQRFLLRFLRLIFFGARSLRHVERRSAFGRCCCIRHSGATWPDIEPSEIEDHLNFSNMCQSICGDVPQWGVATKFDGK